MTEQSVTRREQDMAGDVALLAARLLVAPLFLVSGFGKLGDIAGTADQLAELGFPLSTLAASCAAALELGGAAALVVGLLTRTTAVALFATRSLPPSCSTGSGRFRLRRSIVR